MSANILILLFCSLFISCGTTRIVTERKINADIFVNGVNKGKNEVKIQQMGFPKKIEIEAKYQGEILGSIHAHRKFTLITFLVGYCTGIGFLTAWTFPDVIIIPTKNFMSDELKNSWDSPQQSIWMKPLNKK
jgi:hypothetical protein